MKEQKIKEIIEKDNWMMDILETVRTLKLPDWWIGAGFVRSKVWDFLHGYKKRTPIPDIDVIYFDSKKLKEIEEKYYEKKLKEIKPEINWSVKNQARMHVLHKDKPYQNSTEALSKWVETATCVGVRLSRKGTIEITAPHGIEDLVNLILRPTPLYESNKELFFQRINNKNWLKKWPNLKIIINK